jgi:CRISPR-associated exonuclease Cas4
MKHPTGTQISYLHICHRKLWLFANGLNMEHTSDLVAEGKLIDEHSYPQRANRWQQLAIEGIKIDHYDAQLGIVREVKKSNKKESAHLAQLKYYLFVLERNGVEARHGILEYPKLRITEEVWLTEEDRQAIPVWEKNVIKIIGQATCPARIEKTICKKCSYYDFCYSE